MATTTAGSLQGDVRAYLAREILPLAQKDLVIHSFGQKFKLEKGHGTAMNFTRYNRLALPYGPLSEAVAAVSQGLTIQQVTGTAQQWGGAATITDVAELTVFHNPFQQAKKLVALQVAETLERNDFLTLLGLTQKNFVNSRGSRASLVAGDVLDPFTIMRTYAALDDIKAPKFNGPTGPHVKADLKDGQPRASANPRSVPHYVAVSRVFPLQDLRQNPTVSNAWSYSDINKLYNAEVGEWSSMRFCASNMVPSFVGVAQVNGSASASGGSLTTGSYFIQVTGVDTQNQYESRIYQVSSSISVTGPSGSITLTTPNLAGFTFNVYIGTTSSPSNLGLSSSGPTTGPFTGQAIQLASNTSITITAVGLGQVPPAAPATGVTVYPVFVFGEDAWGVTELQDVDYNYLNSADKSDPQNQLRIVTWKLFNGAMILNSQFAAIIECASAFSPTFG
jgi:N4-gp56 family major capsid protein